jgi:tetratricopeptide (TPR) repeat protein
MTKYTSALAFLDDDFIMQLYEFHYDKAMDEKTAILSNIAACHMKKKSYWGVIEATSQVLAHDGGNVKALFRRGSARRALGQTQEALEDLMRAKTLSEKGSVDPGILREIAAATQDVREQHKTQGSLYKAMMVQSTLHEERDVSDKEETNSRTIDTSSDGQPPPMTGGSRTTDTKTSPKMGNLIYEWCIRVLDWISSLLMGSRRSGEVMKKND